MKTEELISVLASDVEAADASQIHAFHHRRVWVNCSHWRRRWMR